MFLLAAKLPVLPAPSFAVKVMVTLELEATLLAETLMSDCAREAAPGDTVTLGRVDVTAEPPMLAAIVVAVPAVVPVKVAV